MKSNALAVTLSPFKLLNNRHALAALHRTLEISPTGVRGCSSFGVLEVMVDLGVTETCYVDTAVFLAVLDSLPKDKELKLSPKENILNWKCGTSKGKLALVVLPDNKAIPSLDQVEINKKPWKVIPEFGEALELGAMSCDSNTLASVGMHGITIDNRGGISICSTDNTTISFCRAAEKSIPRAPDIMTLHPDAARLLSSVTRRGVGKMLCDDRYLYFFNDEVRLLVYQAPKLKRDLTEIADNYGEAENSAKVPPARITAFIARVGALAESRKHAHVGLRIADGRVALSFAEGSASSDEYFLVEGMGDLPSIPPIQLNAEKLSRALLYVQTIVADYVEKGVIVMRGEDPPFFYMIAGRTADEAES